MYTPRRNKLACLKGSLTNKVMVLDLDETLVHSSDDKTLSQYINLNDPDIARRYYNLKFRDPNHGQVELWGMYRPGMKEFLNFCNEYFQCVVVWSAGTPHYVKAIVDDIFKDIDPPKLVYARDKCVKYEDLLIKPLDMIINENPEIFRCGLDRVYVLDDRETTFSLTNPGNAIHIPVFSPKIGDETMGRNDAALDHVMNWLMNPHVRNVDDIRTLKKCNIFNQPLPIFGLGKTIKPTKAPTKSQLEKIKASLVLLCRA